VKVNLCFYPKLAPKLAPTNWCPARRSRQSGVRQIAGNNKHRRCSPIPAQGSLWNPGDKVNLSIRSQPCKGCRQTAFHGSHIRYWPARNRNAPLHWEQAQRGGGRWRL